MRAVFVLVVVAILAVNKAHGLECYICDNCAEIGDLKASECDGENSVIADPPNFIPTTIEPTTTTEEPTTITTEEPTITSTEEPTITTDEPTTITTEEPSTTEGVYLLSSENKPSANRFRREIAKAEEEYQCFKFSIAYGSGTIVKRGCTKLPNCTDIEAEYNKDLVSDCNLCEDADGCNPATNIKSLAFSSIVLIAIMKIFL